MVLIEANVERICRFVERNCAMEVGSLGAIVEVKAEFGEWGLVFLLDLLVVVF